MLFYVCSFMNKMMQNKANLNENWKTQVLILIKWKEFKSHFLLISLMKSSIIWLNQFYLQKLNFAHYLCYLSYFCGKGYFLVLYICWSMNKKMQNKANLNENWKRQIHILIKWNQLNSHFLPTSLIKGSINWLILLCMQKLDFAH